MYQEAVGRSKKGAERFEAQLRVADGLQDLGRLDEAAAFYHELMGKEVNPTRLARLRLAMGRLLVKQGRVEDGIEMLKRVADDSQTPDLPAEAQFEIGRTYERVLEDFGSAVTAYDAVASKKPSRELGQMAQKRKGSMTQMNTYLEKRETASADSLPVLDFNIAEQYLLTLDRPGQALEHYRAVVDEGSNETLAAKSLLAIAWIREHVDGDSSGATLEYRQLVDFYPETEFADRAREALGLPPRPKPETVDTLSTEIPAGPPAGGATADSLSAASAAAVAASGDSTARPVAGADSARVRPRSSRPRGAERTGPGARPARGDSSATAGRKPVAAADSLARGARPEGPPRPPGLPPGWSGPAAPDSVPAGAPADTAKAREAKPGSGSGEARGIHLPDSLSSTGGQSQAADSTTGRVSGPPAGGENSGGEPSPPPPTGENHAVAPADSV
jgi:tetratricopeptide (TPR) repeat protein